jgi:hypothetical protein
MTRVMDVVGFKKDVENIEVIKEDRIFCGMTREGRH